MYFTLTPRDWDDLLDDVRTFPVRVDPVVHPVYLAEVPEVTEPSVPMPADFSM